MSRLTQVPASVFPMVFAYGAFTLCGPAFQPVLLTSVDLCRRSYYPTLRVATHVVRAPARSLAATCAIVGLLSFPPGTEMFQFPGFAPSTKGG